LPAFMQIEQRPKRAKQAGEPKPKLRRQPIVATPVTEQTKKSESRCSGGSSNAAGSGAAPVAAPAPASTPASSKASGKRPMPAAGGGPAGLGAEIFRPSKRQKVQLPWMASVADGARRRAICSDITMEHVRNVYCMLRGLWDRADGEETGVLDFESIYMAQTGDLVLSRELLDAILDEMEDANVCMYRNGNVHLI